MGSQIMVRNVGSSEKNLQSDIGLRHVGLGASAEKVDPFVLG